MFIHILALQYSASEPALLYDKSLKGLILRDLGWPRNNSLIFWFENVKSSLSTAKLLIDLLFLSFTTLVLFWLSVVSMIINLLKIQEKKISS